MANPLENCTDTELLYELMRRNKIDAAAPQTRRCTPHSEVVIAVGLDHVAYITLDDETLALIQSIHGE